MMPHGSPVPFTFLLHIPVEDVLRLQVPAPDLTAFNVCPSNTSGRLPFVSVNEQITLLVLLQT